MKRYLVFIFVFLIATFAKAENSGGFMGIDIARNYGSQEVTQQGGPNDGKTWKNLGLKGLKVGFLAGYKHFFTQNFGIRAYGTFDYGALVGYDKVGMENGDKRMVAGALSIMANVDAMYNFCDCDNRIFGAYAGVSAGYIDYHVSNIGVVEGLDMAFTMGFRAVFSERHSLELYRRFGKSLTAGGIKYADGDSVRTRTMKISRPDITGIRYVVNF